MPKYGTLEDERSWWTVRLIDADALLKEAEFDDNFRLVIPVSKIIKASTIFLQSKTPSCYIPDGDGCAYQCYDGDDEPIDKCKECPLCYSDKQRHYSI